MDFGSLTYSQWTPSTTAASIDTWTSVEATAASALKATAMSVISAAPDADDWADLISYSQIYRGAEASLAIISAQEVLATATESSVQAMASQVIYNNTLNLEDLDMELNVYTYNLSVPANAIYFAIFTIVFVYMLITSIKSKYYWYNVTYVCGYGLEFCGWLGRVLSINDTRNNDYYILQFVSLTLAPAFIMAGIYFLFAQLVVIHGRQYSVLKPLWYSYFFISCDVLSLLIQAGGGASASIASNKHEDTTPGTNTVIAGIVVQTFAMSVFIFFWFEFLNRLFFKHPVDFESNSPLKKRSFGNFFKLLFNGKEAKEFKKNELDQFYNPKFAYIRSKLLCGYMPLAITITVLVIYIRCIYRVVELAEGWRGYLITHEVYIMVLDALMIAIAGIIAVPFHPLWTFGKENVVKLATIRKNMDIHKEEEERKVEEDLEQSSNTYLTQQTTQTT